MKRKDYKYEIRGRLSQSSAINILRMIIIKEIDPHAYMEEVKEIIGRDEIKEVREFVSVIFRVRITREVPVCLFEYAKCEGLRVARWEILA